MIDSFSWRSSEYENEASWILDKRFISPLVPRPFGTKKFLDVCSGTGIIAEYAAESGWNVTAVDSNQQMLQHISGDIDVYCSDAHCMPFQDESFDLVVCRQGLQYLDMKKAINEMLRVSKNQVILLHGFVARNSYSMWHDLFRALGRPKRSFFDDCEIRSMIELCGVAKHIENYLFSNESLAFSIDSKNEIEAIISKNATLHQNSICLSDNAIYYTLAWIQNTIYKKLGED